MKPMLGLALALLLPASTHAQETSGDIRGRVRGLSTGAQAHVRATGPALLGERAAVAARDGVFHLLALPPGEYTIRLTAIGFRPVAIRDVRVQLGRTTGLEDVELQPATVELGEITITAPRLSVDPVRTTIGAALEGDELATLPGERDYKSLIAILPHVNTSYHGDPVNVGGSTGLENMYFIDGVNVTNTHNASTGTSLPYNFVQTVEVRAGGYEAQYGRALGAIVNAVTHTGTNTLEMNVFGFMTHGSLTASPRNPPNLNDRDALSYDAGARISGPVVRDRLWFSAAWSPRLERVDREIASLGTFVDHRRAQIFAGKLSWQPAPSASIELSIFGDPSVRNAVEVAPLIAGLVPQNADPYLTRSEGGGTTVALRASRSFTGLRLEAGLARSTTSNGIFASTERGRSEPLYIDRAVDGVIGGGLGFESDITQGRRSAFLRATLLAGRHNFVGGFEYEDNEVSRGFRTTGGVLVQRLDVSSYLTSAESTSGTFHNTIPTLYLQDGWRVHERLTVTAGLRWARQNLSGASGGSAIRMANEWQPRLGFSWQVDGSGRHRVMGSYGRFYQQSPLSLSALFFVDYYQLIKFYSADPRVGGIAADDSLNFTTRETDFTSRRLTGIASENFDEFTLGYERLLGQAARLTVRVIRRELRSSLQFGFDPTASGDSAFPIGTPGTPGFDWLPPPKREYTALEIGLDGRSPRLSYRASYVLSRSYGNYTGLFGSDLGLNNPGNTGTFSNRHHATNTTGLLPNDRTHVLKLNGAVHAGRGVTAGAFLTWQSGTPVSAFADMGFVGPLFVVTRGSQGRTPPIWDVNLRFTWEPPRVGRVAPRVLVDILHVGDPQRAVRLDETAFLIVDEWGTPSGRNPNYRRPTAFQPPMTLRLGVELGF